MQKDKLTKLACARSNPCVTISMNTHRTFPDNQKDVIELKKLKLEAYKQVKNEFGQFPLSDLLEKIDGLDEEIDINYNLESIHIFLSDSTTEIIKSSWPIPQNIVSVADKFVIKPLIKDFNRMVEYLILLLSQTDVRLLHAINDGIAEEIKPDDFPFTTNPHFTVEEDKAGNDQHLDNKFLEFYNQIDKALLKIYNKNKMKVVVISTEQNWSHLMQVADKASIYYGTLSINNKDSANHSIAANAWKIVSAIQEKGRGQAIQEMKDAAGQGKVITDLSEMYRAVKEGRGDLLIVHDDFHQAVKMTGELTFDLVSDLTQPEVIDDISSDMAWEVISKKGRAIFTNQDELKSLGNIALKVRY